MDNMITVFIQENRILITLVMGIVVLIGSIMNWNWLCDPTGAPTLGFMAEALEE